MLFIELRFVRANAWLNGLAVCLLSVNVAAGQPASPSIQDDAESQIHELLRQQAQHWNAGNIEGFMETYWQSPQLTFSSGGQTTRGWQATLDRYRQKYSTKEQMGFLKFDNFEFTRLGPDAALVLGSWHLTRKDDAPQGRFSLVFKRIEGDWKIIHDHTSSLQE